MESSEESSLFWIPDRLRRTSESPDARYQSPPCPWSPRATTSRRRVSDVMRRTSRSTPEEESYGTSSASSPILHRTSRKWSDAQSHISRDARASRSRRRSLPSRPFTRGKAIQERGFTSYSPSTPPERQHRPRSLSIKEDDRKNIVLLRAPRRRSKHDLRPGIESEPTSDEIMAPRAPASATDKYRSRAPAAIKYGRSVIEAPTRPRMRVVLSKNPTSLSSPSPPIDEFTDIPPVELILFEPPMSQIEEVPRPHQWVTPRMSSAPKGTREAWQQTGTRKDDARATLSSAKTVALQPAATPTGFYERPASIAEPAAAERITYLQVWVLFVAAAATLSLPLGMVILSYLSTPVRDMSSFTSGPPSTAKTSAFSYTLPVPQTQQTVDAWKGVPAGCRSMVKIRDDAHLVAPRDSTNVSRSARSNLFCLYNNSRFHRGGSFDFLPQNMPFTHCQNIIYWSFGIIDGVPTSRARAFDHTYGLERFREIAENSGAHDVKILLAIGGYREDYAQLSYLRSDSYALSFFVQRTMALMRSLFLNGVTIHWMDGELMCRGSAVNDGNTLRAILFGLRQVFLLNSFPGQLAAIVPEKNDIVDVAVDMADIVFLDTPAMWTFPINYSICGDWAHQVDLKMTALSLQLTNASRVKKLCFIMSVAPLVVEATPWTYGDPDPRLNRTSQSSTWGNAPGTGSAWDMCGSKGCCLISLNNTSTSCIFLTNTLGRAPFFVHVLNGQAALNTAFRATSTNFSHRCALLIDLDLDNYADQSGYGLAPYWLIRYVHEALNSQALAFAKRTVTTC
ncbi:hypothetical protein HPB50_012337 [Hyalomma asiaticum]|uniref:Uncharacterized protein n=1 Tax=Hyalomma asiaticum TaxID=266040 RepID=A0ACB7S0A4_HYAAI|nr:hypothetical protein HPB50_012337 [Hyalomma asiaticum]